MLKYNIKLSENDFQSKELVWSEKYLDPSLAFVSGVTDAVNHVDNRNTIVATNNIIISDGTLSLRSNNVKREGYIVVKEKRYIMHYDTFIDYSSNQSGDTIEYGYTLINGKYYYSYRSGRFSTNITIKNWLAETADGVKEVDYTIVRPTPTFKLDTIYWIEDGKVNIDGNTYSFNRNMCTDGQSGLSYYPNGEILPSSAITNCSEIIPHPYESPTDYQEVTKFVIEKDNEIGVKFERITHCNYFNYVLYKNHYCPIKQVFGDDNSYSFKCEIPLYVLSATTLDMESMETREFDVLFTYSDDEEYEIITNENVDKHGVYTLDDLYKISCYIIVDKAMFFVNNDVQNSNNGKQIGIYLKNGHESIVIGDTIRLRNDSTEPSTIVVHDKLSDNGRPYIFYKNNIYYVEENICSKALINGIEYDIEFINDKIIDGENCLIDINGEKVPFYLEDDYVKRYGFTVVEDANGNSIAREAAYEVKWYDGVVIDEKKYLVHESISDIDSYRYVIIDDIDNEYVFSVESIKGSSLLICKPYLNESDYTMDYIQEISQEICDTIVINQSLYSLYLKNKIFGDKEITKTLAFTNNKKPLSSDDYYNLFDNLVLYNRNGYITVPLHFEINDGGNPLQDDIVQRDFFDAEKKKAINPIIDMEKDVYVPKFIEKNGTNDNVEYIGAKTIFKSIEKININLHFRTRNVDPYTGNWKIYEDYNDASASGHCNWFITDWVGYNKFYTSSSANTLQETSDLLGMLFFTNNDVFYQKSKLAKSFVRFSFYDSTDSQTQHLLATSTIFIDEHALFKKFIDNSKKVPSGYTIFNQDTTKLNNKITVFTEANNSKATVVIDEDKRLSSKIVIKNKYDNDTSSEGFYLYMFKEYAENLHPKPIYMKVEFYHAGVGRIIPFTIPMYWDGMNGTAYPKSGETTPISALTLSNNDDLQIMKQGCPLSFVQAQSYIPLYCVYDFINKEYAYVFDDRYFINDSKKKIYENGVINLNLFELKIQNETENSDEIAKIISKKQQVKPIININQTFEQ